MKSVPALHLSRQKKTIIKTIMGSTKTMPSPSSTFLLLLLLSVILVTSLLSVEVISANNNLVREDTTTTATKIGRTFYFESHGRDDRREWRAAFLKGLRVAKIDFNFQNNSTHCAQQIRINPNKTLTPANFPNGCFVLSHYYDPTTLDYSLPSDLLDFIADPLSQQDIFSAERKEQSGPVIIQMCLKNKPGSCCPIQDGSDCDKWLQLYDAFYAEANAKIPQTLQENRVKFVFDSVGGESDVCFLPPTARFGNWNSTWTGDLSYAQDNIGPHAIQQMPNMEWSSTKSWNSIYNLNISSPSSSPHWGKFYDESTEYPIVAWEPSNEETIKLWHEWVLSHEIYRPSGVLVAFNPDPMLFHVMTSERTKRFSHEAVGSTEMNGPVAAPVESISQILAQNNNNNNNISQRLTDSPLLLRCGSKSSLLGKNVIECILYQRDSHSQFIPLQNTLHQLDSTIASKFSLPLRHMIVIGSTPLTQQQQQQQQQFSSSSSTTTTAVYAVMIFDNNGQLHTLKMETPGVSSSSPIPSQQPKWGSFGGCPPIPFLNLVFSSSTSSTTKNLNNFQSSGFNHFFDDENNNIIFSAAAIVSSAGSSSSSSSPVYSISVASLSAPFPINQIGSSSSPCLGTLSPVISSPTTVVQNICYNNTDVGVCATTMSKNLHKNHDHHFIVQNHKKETKNIEPQHLFSSRSSSSSSSSSSNKNDVEKQQNETTTMMTSFPSSSISIATTLVPSNNTLKSIVCYSLDRRVFCSTQLFDLNNGGLISTNPAVNAPPVVTSTGTTPSVSFALSSSSTSSNNNNLPFLIRFGNSFCQNTMLIDDNTGKYFGDHICDMRDKVFTDLTSHTDLQGYLFAQDVSFLDSAISQGNQHLHGFASVCDSNLMHGTFDSGSDGGVPILYRANPQLFDDDMAAVGSFVAVVPLRSLFLVTPSFCGSSNPGFGKLRLDAFPLPGMIFNYSASP